MIMHFLLLDTSLSGLAIGLVRREQIKDHFVETLIGSSLYPVRNEGFTKLNQYTAELCRKNQLPLTGIDGLVVAKGPGSFTGIRIGLAFVQGLVAGIQVLSGKNILVKGVSSLEVLGGWYLKKANECRQQMVLFPSTATHAYLALVQRQEEELGSSCLYYSKLMEIKEITERSGIFSNFAEDLIDVTIIENNISTFAAAFETQKISFTQKTSQNTLEDIIHALKTSIGKDFPLGFQTELPQADYARLSTAEERVASKKN